MATEVAEQAIDEAGLGRGGQGQGAGHEYLRKVIGKPPLVQAQRLQAMLMRRGFLDGVGVAGGRKAALPPEGWD